jgi:acetyl/propionyl-CoA carboxylase alpha subunit
VKSVFIANRGEIAARIERTCARLGLASTASPGDFLDAEAQVAQALAAGADAVHPGYGFLSENAAFARAVIAAGLAWVGPPPSVIEQMGRKDAARDIAVAAGVPVVPDFSLVEPVETSYPVLVKAAAGGGGRGMRVVRSAAEMDEAMAAAKRESLAAFGDDTMLVERYVERGRHVEVQVMADTHGTVLHLFERDCSTQRRHQKVIEEAPAPTLSPASRRKLHAAAVALARQVGYVGAGTVEFLVDESTGEAFFLEMNTRLQVEHPVTEATIRIRGQGLDLVELQLRVAAGEPLGLTQDEIRCDGHAIEARVYAEDAFHGFLPQAGTTSIVRWPAGARVDHALEPEQVVSTAYDPMLGKVIVHGPDRESARLALVAALDDTVILGLTTNVGFLRALAASDEFRDATIDTAWLDRHSVPSPAAELPRMFVAWISAMITAVSDTGHPFQADGFRLGGPPAATVVPLDREVVVDRSSGTVDGVPVRQVSAADHVLTLVVDGRSVSMVVNVQDDGTTEASYRGHRFAFTRPDPLADHGPAVGDGSVTAPMPGTVLSVRVAAGDTVVEGDPLGVLEAMKMELTLRAPFAGTVASVEAVAGGQVPLGAALFRVEPAGGAS